MFAFGAIVSLCYIPGLTGAFIATQWPVLSILLPLALWRAGPVTVFHRAGLLFLAYATAALAFAPIFSDGVYGLWMVCIMGLSFWLGSTLPDLRALCAGLAAGASVSSAVAVSQALGYSFVPYVSDAPAGLYVNSVASGMIGALLIVAMVAERKWVWVPFLLPGVVLSGSRGAWLALVVGLVAAYVRRIWIFGVIGAAGLFFLALPLSQSDAIRASIWSAAASNLTWHGWGPGSFFSWLLWRDGRSFYPEYAHNDALQLAFEYGVFALLPLGIFAFVLARTTEREWPLFVAFMVAGCYSMPLWVPVASFLGCATAGRIVGGWSLARVVGRSRRQHVLPWRRRASRQGFAIVPVVAHS